MKPEDMPKMMDMMMEKIFKEMKTEDKMAFMENMMPRCMGMMLENMNDEDRKSFAEKMMNRMFSELKKKRCLMITRRAHIGMINYGQLVSKKLRCS